MANELGSEQSKSRFSDQFWYLAIGLAVVVVYVGGVFTIAKFLPERYWPTKRWLAFAFFTFFFFVMLVKMYWRAHKPRRFWRLIMFLFAGHLIVTAPLVAYIQHAYIYPMFMPFEMMLMVFVIKRVVNVMPHFARPL